MCYTISITNIILIYIYEDILFLYNIKIPDVRHLDLAGKGLGN